MKPVAVLDIGGTKLAAGLAVPRADGVNIEGLRTRATPARQGARAVLDAAIGLLEQVLAEAPETVERLGVATAGVVVPGSGLVTHATAALPGWTGTAVGQQLGRGLGLAASVLNDVHAHALGEATGGVGRGATTFLLAAVGTGIGGGFVLDAGSGAGPLFGHDFVAGHLGHVPAPEAAGLVCSCGRIGHLEALASGPGLLAWHHRHGGTTDSTRGLDALAHSADTGAEAELCRRHLSTAGRALGRVLGGLANTLNPEVIGLAGGLTGCGPLWHDAVRAGFAQEALDLVAATPIRSARHSGCGALLGAAVFADPRFAAAAANADQPTPAANADQPTPAANADQPNPARAGS